MKHEKIDISIIIVSFNTKEILEECINSLLQHLKNLVYEIIIIDNNSRDGSDRYLKKVMRKRSIICRFLKENIGFGKANNIGMKLSRGKYILLLNSDCIIKNNVIYRVKKWMDLHQKYGIASPNLYNADGSVQGTGGFFPTLLRTFSWMTIQDVPYVDAIIKPFHPMKSDSLFSGQNFYRKAKDLDWVTGAFFMLRRKTFEDVGYFDDEYFMYTEEVDYSYRSKRKGWFIRYLPFSGVIHLGGASGSKAGSIMKEFEGIKLFYRKHYPSWQYPVLRLFLKIGCLWRMIVFGLIEGRGVGRVYAKMFLTV